MAAEWFYQVDGQQHGPVSPEQLRQLAASGKLKPNDLVRPATMEEWIPARRVRGLFGEQTPSGSSKLADVPPHVTPQHPSTPPQLPPLPQSARQYAAPALPTLNELIARLFGPEFVIATCRSFAMLALPATIAAAIAAVATALLFTLRTKVTIPILLGVSAAAGLVASYFVLHSLLKAVLPLRFRSRVILAGTSLVKCLSGFFVLVAVLSLLSGIVLGVFAKAWFQVVLGVAAFVVAMHFALTLANHSMFASRVSPEHAAADELTGIASLLAQALGCLSAVSYTVCMIAAAVLFALACAFLVQKESIASELMLPPTELGESDVIIEQLLADAVSQVKSQATALLYILLGMKMAIVAVVFPLLCYLGALVGDFLAALMQKLLGIEAEQAERSVEA